MFLFLSSIIIHSYYHGNGVRESFAAVNLNKDRVSANRWIDEEILKEKPKAIQERTENPVMTYDEVVDHDSPPWYGEDVLDEHPIAIQEKHVGTVPEYDEGGASYSHR
jgi:hypothetical protein